MTSLGKSEYKPFFLFSMRFLRKNQGREGERPRERKEGGGRRVGDGENMKRKGKKREKRKKSMTW